MWGRNAGSKVEFNDGSLAAGGFESLLKIKGPFWAGLLRIRIVAEGLILRGKPVKLLQLMEEQFAPLSYCNSLDAEILGRRRVSRNLIPTEKPAVFSA